LEPIGNLPEIADFGAGEFNLRAAIMLVRREKNRNHAQDTRNKTDYDYNAYQREYRKKKREAKKNPGLIT
jgi:hypothetical protein